MNMIEKVDLTKAYYLQHLITEHYQECMDEWYKKCKFKKDKEVEMKKVEKYIREIIKANGELSTTYKHSKDSNNYGRLFAYPSIQSLSCNIRGFLFCGHTDFDFKNAHPKILQYICKLLNILCPCLTYYNNNREEILKKAGNEKEKLRKKIEAKEKQREKK